MIDAKLVATIADLSRDELIDVLDEAVGVGIVDERDTDDLRAEVRALYERGVVTAETILNAYAGGL